MAAILVLAGCGDDDDSSDDPAVVLAPHEDARNSGDVDAVTALHAEDAVVEFHPLGESDAGDGSHGDSRP